MQAVSAQATASDLPVVAGGGPWCAAPARWIVRSRGDQAGNWRELNRASWDERVPIHLDGAFYDVAGFRGLPDSLKGFETAEVGDVRNRSLIPGGFLYLAEFHPFSFVLDDETGTTVTHDSFEEGPEASGGPGSYADEAAATEHNETVEWRHSLATVVSAIAGAGLRIDFLHEHDHTFYLQRQSLQSPDDEAYRHPEGAPRYPLTYSIRARKL